MTGWEEFQLCLLLNPSLVKAWENVLDDTGQWRKEYEKHIRDEGDKNV